MARSVERIRRRWKPRKVRVLLVGESPPDGDGFFYKWRRPSPLLGYTREAFSGAFPDVPEDRHAFLVYFKSKGCYLEDLCHSPIIEGEGPGKAARRKNAIPHLARRIRALKPQAVICVLKGIESHVTIASCRGQVDPDSIWAIPFGGQHHQPQYVKELARLLRKLAKLSILN